MTAGGTVGTIGALAAVGVAMLLHSTVVPEQPDWTNFLPDTPPRDDDQYIKFVGGDGVSVLAGRLSYPETASDGDIAPLPPVVVLAHGLGLTQDCSLPKYSVPLSRAGFAVFHFDYTSFGRSEGMPRHQAKASKHIADIQAAVAFLRREADALEIDADRMGLWGTSFGGGHVVAVASKDPDIKAIVSLVPALGSAAESLLGTIQRDPRNTTAGIVKIVGSLFRWIFSSIFLRKTHYVPLIGQPGSNAMMQNPGDYAGYMTIVHGTTNTPRWQNAATVGSALEALFYRPLDYAKDVNCPTMFLVATKDTLCPARFVYKAAEQIEASTVVKFEGAGHFDVYEGNEYDRSIGTTVKFFQQHL